MIKGVFCSTLIKNQFFLRKDFDLVFGHKNFSKRFSALCSSF